MRNKGRQVGVKKLRSFIDFKQIDEQDSEDFSVLMEKLNELIEGVNFLNKNMSLSNNFNGYIFTDTWTSGQTKKIQHFLGTKPLYRIILRQEGNGVLSDIPSQWDDKVISMINNGASTVTATILVLKE
jgi:hypothetical protein